MSRKLLHTALLLLTSITARAAAAQDLVVVISAKNSDELLADIRYALGSAGSAAMRDLVDGSIEQGTQGKGLIGVDRTKPLGGYMGVSSAGNPELVIFVPVSDPKGFRELLSMYFPKQQDLPGGIFSIQEEDQQFFGRFAHGHCFLAVVASALNRLPDPAEFAATKHDISIDADLAKVPEEMKDDLVKQLEESLATTPLESPQPTSEREARAREYMRKIGKQMLRQFIKESDRLNIALNIDRESKTATADLSVVPRVGTELARLVGEYSESKSQFAGLIGAESIASLSFATPLSKATREPIREAIENAVSRRHAAIEESVRFKNAEQRQPAHQLVDRVEEVLLATADVGRANSVVVLNSPIEGKAQLVAASTIERASDLEQAIESFSNKAGEAGRDVALDVAKHAGARIHAITPELTEADAQRFGDGPAHLAILDDALYFALGGDSLAAVRAAIDQTGKPAATARPPVSARLQVGSMVSLFAKQDDPNSELAREAFGSGDDQFELDLLPTERGARLRLVFGEAFMRHYTLRLEQSLTE